MTEVVRAALAQIEALMQRGRRLAQIPSVDAIRAWQQDCAGLVNQLSGGSKAHWLSRAFSQAFLVRATDGGVVVEATSAEIVERLLDVLAQARSSVAQMTEETGFGDLGTGLGAPGTRDPSPTHPSPRRFEFVHTAELRPVLERALTDGRAALETGDARQSLILFASVLEAIMTDALEHAAVRLKPDTTEPLAPATSHQPPATVIAALSFDQRIDAAERAGLIRGGCARLPAVARRYRELAEPAAGAPAAPVNERDARVTGQVLHVVMRDLDPGR